MRLASFSALALLAFASLATSQAIAGEIVVATEEYPPFNMTENGHVVGLSTDLVRAIFEKAGVAYRLDVLPWQRAYNSALNDKDTCVYSTTETEERKGLFEWVGPLVNNDWALFAAADKPVTLAKLEDARGLLIGGYAGDAIAVFLEKEGYKIDAAPRDDLNPAKLVNGRVDLWATGSELGLFLARQQGLSGKIKQVLGFKVTVMSLACNKNTDPAVLARLRAALSEVRAGKRG